MWKIFCQGEEVHLISRFQEDQILEIGSALFMIFSFFLLYFNYLFTLFLHLAVEECI